MQFCDSERAPLGPDTFTGPWAGLPVAWTKSNTFDEGTYRRDVATASGFLGVNLRGRGPYPAATPDDVDAWRSWCTKNFPEMLQP